MQIPIRSAAAADNLPALTPEQRIRILIALDMGDLLPDIAAAAEQRADIAVMRGADHEADFWFRIQEAADDMMLHAPVLVAIGGGRDRRIG